MKKYYFLMSIALVALCFVAPFPLIHYINNYDGAEKLLRNHVPLEYIKCLFIYLFFWGFCLAFMFLSTQARTKRFSRNFLMLCVALPVSLSVLLFTTNGFFFCMFAFLFGIAAIGFSRDKLFSPLGYKQLVQNLKNMKGTTKK